jgi:hypothetical protein
MSESLLDECRESILKIAETQSPDGRRAILAMARMFQVNSDPGSSRGQTSSRKPDARTTAHTHKQLILLKNGATKLRPINKDKG